MEKNSTKQSKETKSIYTQNWLDTFTLFLTLVKTLIFMICVMLLYPLFVDSFDFSKTPTVLVIKSKNQPNAQEVNVDKIENGIHIASGLVYADNFEVVRGNCTACHSGKLIAQNRASREGWQQMIRWMQATQGLWDLGKNEPKILDYLEANYSPKEVGRRSNIDMEKIEWYILKL